MATTIKDDELLCVAHNKVLKKSNFYIAEQSSLYGEIGRIPVCKSCVAKLADKYQERYGDDYRRSLYMMCRKLDVPFSNSLYEGCLNSTVKERDTKEKGKDVKNIFGWYMRQFNSIGSKNGVVGSFDDGEELEYLDEYEGSKEQKQQESRGGDTIALTEQELITKREVIEMLEYDPFEDYSIVDQKFLYTDLLSYFGDEDVVEDRYLVSQLVQIVNNNNTIRKMDYIISTLSGDPEMLIQNEGKIKSISTTKNGIVANNDKIAKENGIAVNKRKDSNVKKSTLTATMEYLRSLNFEDAEVDYYDQKKAYGMKVTADVSFKAIADQLQFDENDVKEMLDMQRELIREQEEKLLDLEEENRKLYEEIELFKK